jgi:hypothetical protein
MSRLRERLYREYKLEEKQMDFMGYGFGSKKELSTHHIIPRKSGGQTKKNNLCILNRNTSHNYIHLIEDTDYKYFTRISAYLMEQVKKGQISKEEILKIYELLESFEKKYKNRESKSGGVLIKEEYKQRVLKL